MRVDSDGFMELITDYGATPELSLRITFADGTYTIINSSGIMAEGNSLSTEASSKLPVGQVIASSVQLTLSNHSGSLSNYDFDGARVRVSLHAADYESQTQAALNIGHFYIEQPEYTEGAVSVVTLTGYDCCRKLDVPYDFRIAAGSITHLNTLFESCLACAGLTWQAADKAARSVSTSVLQASTRVPVGSYTCRQIVGWIAEYLGANIIADNDNADTVKFVAFKERNEETAHDIYPFDTSFEKADKTISGVSAQDVTYTDEGATAVLSTKQSSELGSYPYAFDTGNMLGLVNTAGFNYIESGVKDLTVRNFSANAGFNPLIELTDMVMIHAASDTFFSYVTKMTMDLIGAVSLECQTETEAQAQGSVANPTSQMAQTMESIPANVCGVWEPKCNQLKDISTAVGQYIKFGDTVICTFYICGTSKGSGRQYIKVTGIPFTPSEDYFCGGGCAQNISTLANYSFCGWQMNASGEIYARAAATGSAEGTRTSGYCYAGSDNTVEQRLSGMIMFKTS